MKPEEGHGPSIYLNGVMIPVKHFLERLGPSEILQGVMISVKYLKGVIVLVKHLSVFSTSGKFNILATLK